MPYEVGYEFPPFTMEVSAATIREYAEASFDYNPLHLDPSWMESADFGGTSYGSIIAHGLMMYSYVGNMMTSAVAPLGGWHERCELRFVAPVKPGNTVSTHGTVTSVRDEDDFTLYEASIEVRVDDGTVVQKGTAFGRLPKDGGRESWLTGPRT